MARTKQTMRDRNEPSSEWKQRRRYTDHQGHPVVLEEYVRPNHTPEPSEQLAIQVYSTVPIDEDHVSLHDYLLGAQSNRERLPLFEIYSYCPTDVWDCIEHQRREIAHRKRQHQILATENPPPLIPLLHNLTYGHPAGFCILLNSHSYRLGHITDTDRYRALGPAPDLVFLNRKFGDCFTAADQDSRLSREEGVLYPEAFEAEITRVRHEDELGIRLVLDIFHNRTGLGPHRPSRLLYGLDEIEGEALHPDFSPDADRIRQDLEQQFIDLDWFFNASLRLTHDSSDGNMSVTTSMSTTPVSDESAQSAQTGEADLQYLISVPFLSRLRDTNPTAATDLLEQAARLFTAAVAAHLPPNQPKTLRFKFHIPESVSNSWSSITPAHHHHQLTQNQNTFQIGALHTFSPQIPVYGSNDPVTPATLHRLSPQSRKDSLPDLRRLWSHPYKTFAVVLQSANFVRWAGVYFYLTDLTEDGLAYGENPPTTQVWRCSGMEEVARRLAMLVVEEEGQEHGQGAGAGEVVEEEDLLD